jgi:hypothetical protein
MATLSLKRTGRKAADWINLAGLEWVGVVQRIFQGTELKMLGECLSTDAASKKGFISNVDRCLLREA